MKETSSTPGKPKKDVKLAPLFVPKAKASKKKETGPSKAEVEARSLFLASGLPEQVVKQAAKISEMRFILTNFIL